MHPPAATGPFTPTTRLAPSPTGALHLGHAMSFLLTWALARRQGWRILLRLEDLNVYNVDQALLDDTLATLDWLGVNWDDGPVNQRGDIACYQEAVDRLYAADRIYPCVCSRRDLQQAGLAPHADDGETRYPGICLHNPPKTQTSWARSIDFAHEFAHRPHAWRIRVPDASIAFEDGLWGPCRVNVQQQVGDFLVVAKNTLPTYQLAVVVDDMRQSITHVVRGNDLLDSTARQLYLMQALDPAHRPPAYLHLPLVRGPDGRRLAKRHGDTRLSQYRQAGVAVERLIGLVAWWAGCQPQRQPMSITDFLACLQPDALPRCDMIFRDQDDQWLKETT